MIAYLEGEIISVLESSAVINVNSVGYEVNMAKPTLEILTPEDNVKVFISESISPYDGTVLYGFLSYSELELFKLLRTSVPGTGAKKALEYLSKVMRAMADFKKAIINKDIRILTGIFGFTQKTAVKLVDALKDKISSVKISADSKIYIADTDASQQNVFNQVFQALLSLGFSAGQSKKAIEVLHQTDTNHKTTEELIKYALKVISK